MFEVQCPSCHASYKVDERRIPPTGLNMRCPKCGSSFQVASPMHSEPPVLGGALGLPRGPHKATMIGVAASDSPPRPVAPGPVAAPPAAGPPAAPPRTTKQTMIGVAPAQMKPPAAAGSAGIELASFDEPAPSTRELDDFEAPIGQHETGQSSASSSEFDLDLPVKSPRPRAAEIELPADDGGFDLEGVGSEADLPALGGGDSALPDLPRRDDGIGLPDLSEADLPTVSGGVGLPAFGGGASLPALSSAALPDLSSAALPDLGGSLPVVSGALPGLLETELPIIGGSLPSPAKAGGLLPSMAARLPNLAGPTELPVESLDDDLEFDVPSDDLGHDGFALSRAPAPPRPGAPQRAPMPGADTFGSGPTTTPESGRPGASPSAFGEVALDGGGDDDEFDAFPTEDRKEGSRGTEGTTGYGDVALDEGSSGLGLGADVDRGPLPAGPAPAASAQVELPTARELAGKSVPAPKKSMPRTTKIAIFAALSLAVAGGAMASFIPDVGPYGAYLVIDFVRASSHREALAADALGARRALVLDVAPEVERAYQKLDQGREEAPRYRPRAAYAAFIGLLSHIRFGAGSRAATGGRATLDALAERDPAEVEYLELARLAASATEARYGEALSRAKGRMGESPEITGFVGEVALAAKDFELAETAFTKLVATAPGAWGHSGLARVHLRTGKLDQAKAEAEKALVANARHVGAVLVLAELDLRERKLDQPLLDRLTPIATGKSAASRAETVAALVLVGDLHMSRARLKEAEAAFAKALELESGSAPAQRGLADALFEGGRFSEAQTRYEAALGADSTSLAAGIGVVRCKLQLEELEEAAAVVDRLLKTHPESTIVHYWVGRAKERVGAKEEAQKAYEKAIALDQNSSELVEAYIAVARLLGQQGKTAEAEVVMAKAEVRFPDDALVYEALAELSSGRGSFEEAIADYDKALSLDPGNIGLRFARGIVLRKARRFEEAGKEFDAVAEKSKDYPGLALERGNLYEASGKSKEALEAYELALSAAPDDLDLQLRVACGKAAAKQSKAALEQIQKVYKERPNSAEVNFCMGLAYLHQPALPDARRHLLRAVGFDASRANYHLYVGWTALEMADYPLARRSLDKALELDQTLADAYWKRGELSVRQGAVDDAVIDLNRALELSPTRLEAHAQLAMAHMQRGDEPLAMAEWKLATETEFASAYDHFQYGKLLYDNKMVAEAVSQLEKAVDKVKLIEPVPPYRWDIHRYYAMALGRRLEAKEHWQAFIDHAPKESPFLREAVRELSAILALAGH